MHHLLLVLAVTLLLNSCGDSTPHSVQTTFSGVLDVPSGRNTKVLCEALKKLGEQYGLSSEGYCTGADNTWSFAAFCSRNLTAAATNAGDGNLVFHVFVYGFKHQEDYETYKAEMMKIMAEYGTLRSLKENPPLTHEELIKREKLMNDDFTSQCEGSKK